MGENPRFWFAFSVLCIACALAGVMSVFLAVSPANAAIDPAVSVPKIIDVQDDPGGNVAEYYNNYAKLSKAGAVVRLHGYCASACTLVLLREYTGIKACAADENAVFAFHKPFEFRHKKILKTKVAVRRSRAIWAAMLASFPYDVYTLLKDARIPSPTEGDSQNDMFVVPAMFFVPRCSSPSAGG